MKKLKNMYRKAGIILTIISIIFSSILSTSCDNFVEPGEPVGKVPQTKVFEDEATATAAVMTLYGSLRDNVMLTGGFYGMNVLMGFYADELDYYGPSGQSIEAFYNHQIVASESLVKSLWNEAYSLIYMCNSAIEGIEESPNLSSSIKDQLKGEAQFIRAITHFYLVNLFGDIPYITTTDYLTNMKVSRMATDLVYEKILSDLNESKSLLTNEYVSGERIRANKYAVSALLSRVYLYLQRWQDAETECSILLSATSVFALESNLSEEFLKESTSAVLQLKPKSEGENTQEASSFLFTSGPPLNLALRPEFIEAFDPLDMRKQNWITEIPGQGGIWFAPYKYKLRENSGTSLEYSIVLRLAEQYLIRAEARAHTGDLPGAKADINVVRNRAGLSDTPASTQAEILQAILNERRFELFTEQGHRWFDLKRTGKAGEVLSAVKPNWEATDVLLPIPEAELLLNPKLLPQNPGYN
ncbi:MAG: starch-binding protein [Bacteroidetes bacterium GWF2_40_14]|nr:MAG: starch-binding protein [Bacteroidetes bacterium GWF2_40_14]